MTLVIFAVKIAKRFYILRQMQKRKYTKRKLGPPQRSAGYDSAERDLWAEVLQRAIKDLKFQGGLPGDLVDQRRKRFELFCWFLDDGDGVGSFKWVCNAAKISGRTIDKILALVMEHKTLVYKS